MSTSAALWSVAMPGASCRSNSPEAQANGLRRKGACWASGQLTYCLHRRQAPLQGLRRWSTWRLLNNMR